MPKIFVVSDEDARKVIELLNNPPIPQIKETHVGAVLDSSGSMLTVKHETIGAYNAFVAEVEASTEAAGKVYANLVTFGEGQGKVKTRFSHVLLSAKKTGLARLTETTYIPSGFTPMYDGIGSMINALERYDVAGKDVAFLVSIFTDGYENFSCEWTQERLNQKILELQAKGNWTFTFIGANVDLSKIQEDLGFLRGNMSSYVADSFGTSLMGQTHSHSSANFMNARAAGNLSVTDFYDSHNHVEPEVQKVENLIRKLVIKNPSSA